jgi:RNA ligase
MTTTLDQIVDLADLEREVAAGYINRRYHPEFPGLALVGYSDRAQFDNHWTPTVRACRGIIYRTDTLEVLARPFAKFFNYGQNVDEGTQYDLDVPIVGAFNKWDGSLGIGYTRPDGRFAIATRGSFDSEQARHATARITQMQLLEGQLLTEVKVTPLYEIIYPDNRIVLDYGDRDELVFLGCVHIETGTYETPLDWHKEGFGATLREVLAQPPRPNAEGFVAWIDAHTAVKFKQDDYLALHRVISNLTVKEVWRQLRAGTYQEFATALPDEFHDWAKRTANGLADRHLAIKAEVDALLDVVLDLADADRKSQALFLKKNGRPDLIGFVFSKLDGRDITDAVWRAVEPAGGGSEIATSELLKAAA